MTTAAEPIRLIPDRVYEVLDARLVPDLRFRASLITSLALHTTVLLIVALAPLLLPRDLLLPPVTPVRLVSFQSVAAPEPEPEPAVEEPLPEPPAVAVTEPTPVPKDLEALKRKREEEKEAERRRIEEEEERRRREEAERRSRAEEERRRREEEERRKPQSAQRRPTQQQEQPQLTQEAQRGGSVGVLGAEQTAGITVEDFEFNYYLNILLDRIAARWDPPPRGPYARELTVVVHFRIDRQGQLVVGPEIQNGSGQTLYDRAALRAISAAAPFPPLPYGYEGRSLGVRLGFKQ